MKIVPISSYDVAAHQAWLEDEAARGNFLLEYRGFCAHFEKGTPKALRYRMEPVVRKGEAEPDEEKKELYAALGWEYVTGNTEFHIWCCEDPAAPELNTDPQVQAAAYARLCRRLKIANWICGVILAIPVLVFAFFSLAREDYGISLFRSWSPMWEIGILCITLVFITGQAIYWQWSLRKYLRTLESGIEMPHRRPYRKSRILTAVLIVVYTTYLISRVVVLFEPNSRSFEPADSFETPVPHVELTEGEMVEAIYWKNWQTAEQWWILQGVDPYDLTESHYYEFYFRGQAGRMARDLAAADDMQPLTDANIDGAWWQINQERGYETLVVWDGRRVVEVTHSGEHSIKEHLADYAALVRE